MRHSQLFMAATLAGVTSLFQSHAQEPQPLKPHAGLRPFQYTNSPVALPNYVAGAKWGTEAEGLHTMQLPLDPAESQRHLVMTPGFEAQLFAAEPEIVKPIAMTWDERGRLWIAETFDYPNEMKPKGEGRDRIKICDDTDGDGRADKFTVFADKLSIPTSIVIANGGLIVIHSGETLFLKDTNGDGVADERRVLFSGWGTGDTHATANNMRWGFDNWIWGTVGYSGFDGEVGGKHIKFGMGVYRFKPDGSALEFIRSSNNNTWGLGFNEEGIVFGSTANNNASWYMPIPNRYYEAVNGWSASRMETIADSQLFYPITDKVRQVDAHGRYTAGAGHAIYTARSFPKNYWNHIAFVTEPTGHLIGHFAMQPEGADFKAHNLGSFLASDDEWTAPIMAEVGPDGALWMIDWYNYIIQHNPTPIGFKTGKGNAYETPLRDKRHGRIYRLVYNAFRPSAKPAVRLDQATPQQLVNTLKSDNMLWRMHAQRLLVERGDKSAADALVKLANSRNLDQIGLNPAAIHALYTLQGLGLLNGSNEGALKAARNNLKNPSPGVRRTAVTVLPRNEEALREILAANLTADPDAQTRLATFLAIAEMPPDEAVAKALIAALQDSRNTEDKWLRHAMIAAAAHNDVAFLKAALTTKTSASGEGEAEVLRVVTGHYAHRAPSDSVTALLALLKGASAARANAVLEGLITSWPADAAPKLGGGDRSLLVAVMDALPDDSRGRLVALARSWGMGDLFASQVAAITKSLRAKIADASLGDDARVDAARNYIRLDDQAASARAVLEEVNLQSSPALASGLMGALGESRDGATGRELLAVWKRFTLAQRRTAIAVLLRRSEWANALLDAVEAKQILRGDLGPEHWQQLRANRDRSLARRARELSQQTEASSADREEIVKRLLPVAGKEGDAARGKEVFMTSCAVCHTFMGQGAKIGPDLTGVGARPRQDILLDILDPNRSVEANYRLWTATTKGGDSFSGRLDAETKTSIDILDLTGQTHTIQRKDLASLDAATTSIMPVGFEAIPENDLASLLTYLAQGKH